jgi:hypothetical protein
MASIVYIGAPWQHAADNSDRIAELLTEIPGWRGYPYSGETMEELLRPRCYYSERSRCSSGQGIGRRCAMANRTERRERADLHGRGSGRNAARPLTAREVAELRAWDVLHPGDRRRLAGIEELRRALNDRFGTTYRCEEVANA